LRDIDNVCEHIVISAGLTTSATGERVTTWEVRR
jgi:hypothetical protein